jgi:uncharacterized protein YndB with AHSA1/START domain
MTREFEVPPERVFHALTDPAELTAWWGAKTEWWMAAASVELKPGGSYRFDFVDEKGGMASITGEFRVVDPPRRLVQTWRNSMFPDVENHLE